MNGWMVEKKTKRIETFFPPFLFLPHLRRIYTSHFGVRVKTKMMMMMKNNQQLKDLCNQKKDSVNRMFEFSFFVLQRKFFKQKKNNIYKNDIIKLGQIFFKSKKEKINLHFLYIKTMMMEKNQFHFHKYDDVSMSSHERNGNKKLKNFNKNHHFWMKM